MLNFVVKDTKVHIQIEENQRSMKEPLDFLCRNTEAKIEYTGLDEVVLALRQHRDPKLAMQAFSRMRRERKRKKAKVITTRIAGGLISPKRALLLAPSREYIIYIYLLSGNVLHPLLFFKIG